MSNQVTTKRCKVGEINIADGVITLWRGRDCGLEGETDRGCGGAFLQVGESCLGDRTFVDFELNIDSSPPIEICGYYPVHYVADKESGGIITHIDATGSGWMFSRWGRK